jgi:hypothetical protein
MQDLALLVPWLAVACRMTDLKLEAAARHARPSCNTACNTHADTHELYMNVLPQNVFMLQFNV